MKTIKKTLYGLAGVSVLGILIVNLPFGNSAPPQPEISDRQWNSDTFKKAEKRFVSKFSTGWKNYLDLDDNWKPIDMSLEPAADGWTMGDSPFRVFIPEFSDGYAVFTNNNRYEPKERKKNNTPPLEHRMKPTGIVRVRGVLETGDLYIHKGFLASRQYVIYRNILPNTDLIYYLHNGEPPRLEKLIVRYTREPLDITFEMIGNFTPRTVDGKILNGPKRTRKGLDLEKSGRVSGIGDFHIWESDKEIIDEERNSQSLDVTLEPVVGGFRLTKHIPQIPLDWTLPIWTDTVSTFKSAAGANSPVDGATEALNTNFTTARNATGGTQNTSDIGTTQRILDKKDGLDYVLARSFHLFDTGSTITAGSTINDTADTKFTVKSSAASSDCDATGFVSVVQSMPASDSTIAAGDWDQYLMTDDTIGVATTKVFKEGHATTQRWDLTGILIDTVKDFDLDTTGIGWIADGDDTKPTGAPSAGITRLGLATKGNIDETAPTCDANQVPVYMRDHATDANHPVLSVDWTAGVSPAGEQVPEIIWFSYLKSLLVNTAQAFFK